MLRRLDRLAYRTQHLSMLINATFMQEGARIMTRTHRPYVSPAEIRCLLRRRTELHDRDLANVEAGLRPALSSRRQNPTLSPRWSSPADPREHTARARAGDRARVQAAHGELCEIASPRK